MIKLVIYDAHGVTIIGGYPNTCKYLAKKYKRNWEELYAIFYKKYFNMAAEKKITQREAWAKSLKECSIPLSVAEIKKIHYGLMRLNLEIVNLSKKTGCRSILLSKNTRSQFYDNCKMFNLKKHFGHAINTWELNLKKAGKETCYYIMDKYNVKPKETIWIDDQEENLIEPKKLGINTILYKNFKQFENQIQSLLKKDL